MYNAIDDPYCYPNTEILRNIPGLLDPQALAQFELVMTTQRADEPLPSGRFSVRHYCAVHQHLFQDVYSWAGKYRLVRISRGRSVFCYPEHIPDEMRGLFASLRQQRLLAGVASAEFCKRAASFLAALNAIHPFRDGNGRAQLTFLAALADRAGHPLDFERLEPERFLQAMIASFHGDEAELAGQLNILAGR